MRIRIFLLLGLIFVVGVVVGLILFSSRAPKGKGDSEITSKVAESAPESGAPLDNPDIVAEDVELVQGAQGRIDWKVQAKLAKYSQTQGKVLVELPQLTAYLGNTREEVFIRADLGEVDQQADILRLWDNVIGRYGLFALKADSFDYIGAMDKIYLKGTVRIERPDVAISSSVVEIDIQGREMVAGGGVEALFSPDGLTQVMEQ